MDSPYIFISYSTKDSAIANDICSTLESNGVNCWIAPRDITPGRRWAQAIMTALKNCSAMVLVYSRESNQSEQVYNEIDKAFSYKRVIIPFLTDTTPMSEELEYYLSRKHWLTAYPDYTKELNNLLEAVKRFYPADALQSRSTPGSPVQPVPQPSSPEEEQVNYLAMGNKYRYGDGLPKDDAEAAKWYRIAAEQGNAEAQNCLGVMYYSGHGVSQDYAKAAKWLRMAAMKGDTNAQCNLGNLYLSGKGVPRDYAEGVKLYRLAAAQGHSESQCRLGEMYLIGGVVPQDYAEAAKWFRMAAEQGHRGAQAMLGYLYEHSKGVPVNYTEAAKWYRMAAEQGHKVAQTNLGFLYRDGEGVPKDYSEAAKWLRMAASQGISVAKKALEDLKRKNSS